MLGHVPLIAMRREGAIPAVVWFDLDAEPSWEARNWPQFSPRHAHVHVAPADRPELLDLRFCIGLMCHVAGTDEAAVRRLHDACIAAGATRVVSSCCRIVWASDGEVVRAEPVFTLDTEGIVTWPNS